MIAGELFIGQTGCLAIFHPQDQHFEVAVHWGREGQVEKIFFWNDCWAMQRGQLHEVMDSQTGLLCHHFIHPPESGYLCVPLLVQGNTLGILCFLGVDRKDGHFADKQLAVAIGEGIKLALFNIELREELPEQAIHDTLTGLYNRRFMEENLEHELSRAQRQNTSLCISMLDIKHFKCINDTFGHAAGDALLAELGRILLENMRKSDIACRYGGDEFVLILPDSTLDDASHRVQQILELVKELRVWHDDQQIESPIISAGVAEAHKHNFSVREILKATDEDLYVAKEAKRDLV